MDDQLRETWRLFCDQLKDAAEVAFRESTPADALTRTEGVRLIARNIALALQFQLENKDPLNPELLRYFDPLRKQGGDNSDALYIGAPINGVDTYRIYGKRGTAAYFAVTVLEDGDTPWGGRVVGSLVDDQVAVEEDGSFELIVSPREHAGNWIRSTAGAWRVTVRQFFGDWEKEQPMQAFIERLGEPTPPSQLSAQALGEGLDNAAKWLRWSVSYWVEMIEKWRAVPHTFIEYGELEERAIDFTPGGAPLISYWQVPPDRALLVRVTPPRASYWAVEFGSYWWETMDYRYRSSGFNSHYAQLEDDGSLLAVVCHGDPLLANWLDPCGHEEGYMTFRWIGADHFPKPQCELVERNQLERHVPAGAKRTTPERRREWLLARRRGVAQRFRS